MKKLFTIVFLLSLYLTGIYSQAVYESMKREALKHMQVGRYGEAIDLLNKYISALPHKADGLHLRGLCYEARSQYEWAALDLRRAVKLDPKNNTLQKDLARVEKVWTELLNKKIEGHKREIAIDPTVAVNYLEIGKCKKHLGLWQEAEWWYDEYLKRDDASPDEVIRYSEILAKNGSIVKGEKILKRYVERFPSDQRLWSRYGYFTYWLGKNRIAIQAFENALALKPHFKEAQDGLDAAKGKPYLFEWVDTTARHKKTPVPPEYPVDKYYRLVRRNPEDIETRYLLVDKLLKHNRLEEAYQQLQILSKTQTDNEKFTVLWDSVSNYRQNLYNIKIKEYSERLKVNSSDREAAVSIAGYYGNLFNYDSSQIVLQNYLNKIAPKEDLDIRYKIAQYAAWNKNWDEAIHQLKILLAKEPKNLDYQLLAGEVYVWTDQELDKAKVHLNNVISGRPNEINAYVTMGFLYLQQNDIDESTKYASLAMGIDSTNESVSKLFSDIELRKLRLEEDKIFQIITDARQDVLDNNCEGALAKYEEYMAKTEPNDIITKEYADVNACAKNYYRAMELYDSLLAKEYNYSLALDRANVMYVMGDSINALTEYKKLNQENPDDRSVQLYLGDSYVKMHEYSEARDIYERLRETSIDSTEIALIDQRLGWVPQTGLKSLLVNFPNYLGFAPSASYYTDNIDFEISNVGGRIDFGFTQFLTGGVSFLRTRFSSPSQTNYLTSFKGHIFLRITQPLVFGAGFGILNIRYADRKNTSDIFIRYEKKDVINITASYDNTDAQLLLYSNYLVNTRVEANYYRISGFYKHKDMFKVSGYFSYLALKDVYRNKANDLQFRIGRKFYDEVFIGYEYFYTNYKYNVSRLYYSPQRFVSHSLWVDWDLVNEKDLKFIAGGRVGYIPQYDASLREIYGEVNYNPVRYVTLSGRIAACSTYRYDYNYNSFSSFLSAYITF